MKSIDNKYEIEVQSSIDKLNAEFWSELCGTSLAKKLGLTDNSYENLRRFDNWYFNYYPYLQSYIPFDSVANKKVLEIGLGYGSVSQKLIEHNSHYHGLDIASGPIQMVENRLKQSKKVGQVQLGSILSPPYSKETFDCIIAIGCLHHTGNLKLAIENVYNLLKTNGNAVIMVYSALSYRQWFSSPFLTLSRLFGNYRVYDNNQYQSSSRLRAAYDTNIEGDAAPQTEFVTKAELKYMLRKFNYVSIESQNIGNEGLFRFIPRRLACKLFGSTLGLDLYCRIQK